jgi:hypothetical protein
MALDARTVTAVYGDDPDAATRSTRVAIGQLDRQVASIFDDGPRALAATA